MERRWRKRFDPPTNVGMAPPMGIKIVIKIFFNFLNRIDRFMVYTEYKNLCLHVYMRNLTH